MRSKPEEFDRREQSLLLYFETRLVDYVGRVASVQMNGDDMEIAKKLEEEGLLQFGRLTMAAIDSFRGHSLTQRYTHWVRFSPEAWTIVHQLRRERSDKMLAKDKDILESEMTKNKNVYTEAREARKQCLTGFPCPV